MRKDILVTLGNKPYLNQLKQLFSSLYFNAQWSGDCMVISDGTLDSKDIEWFQSRGIAVEEYAPLFNEVVGCSHQIAWLKLNIFSPKFRKWENIVFLDGDIIVRGSINELLNLEGLNAVRVINGERGNLKGQFINYKNNNFKALSKKMNMYSKAFNAGVLAFQSKLITDNMLDDLKKIAYSYKDVIFISEETTLNIFFYKQWNELPAVYNICPNWELGFRKCMPSELKGQVLHCYSTMFREKSKQKFWHPEHPLFPEYDFNLKRAEIIDFSAVRSFDNKKSLPANNSHKDGKMLLKLRSKHFIRFLRIRTLQILKNKWSKFNISR